MKRLNPFTICLAGGVALGASVRADTVPLADNPYDMVVARNIFGLNPPVAVDPNPVPVEPPVKITPTGIMNNFGQVVVLFKVAGKVPGKDDSYMLSEGQGQDNIEVDKIDEKNGVVTFNNHGLQQVLPLATAAGSAPVTGPAGGIPGAPTARNFGNSGFNNVFGGRSAPAANSANNPGANPAPDLRSIPTRSGSQEPAMDSAAQTVLIEVNRAQAVNENDPIAGILPPTELTPPDAKGPTGNPLVPPAPDEP